MPWWMVEDVLFGIIYVVAFAVLTTLLVAWSYFYIKPWLVERQKRREWQDQFVAEMLAEGRANLSAAIAPSTPLAEEIEWNEQERGPKWTGESFRDYQTKWAEWYTTERKV